MSVEYCRLTSLNYPIQRKIIVVVGRCIPYLITIFWRNQTVDYIFSWSQQRYRHIDPLDMLCSQNMIFTFSSFVNFTQVNDILPSSSVGRLYRTYVTLLVSLGLTLWLNLLSWSLRPLNVTPKDTEPSTFEVLRRWIVHERRSTPPLLQIYTVRN